MQIFTIFKAFFPDVTLEKASIDEAYLDLTQAVSRHMSQQQAQEATADSTWLQAAFAEAAEASVVVDTQLSPEHDFDARLAVAAQLTGQLRKRVADELQFTISAGISHNKLLAKLASAMNKPNNQVLQCAVQVLVQ